MAERDRGKAARVRDLCRKLKPVIGEQADRIWMAYVVEDETGKSQLLDYLEILSAKHFQDSLDQDGPGLVPPKAEAASGEFVLGKVAYNGQALFPFGLRENELLSHVGIYGRSGAGKTTLGYLLVQQLVRAGKPVLILDWKRNYRDLVNLPGFEDMAIYTAGRSTAPFRFNPLIPPPGTTPQTWIKKIIAVLAHAYLLGDGVMFLMQEAIDQVYSDAGVYGGTMKRWPTFRDVLDYLRNRKAMGREAGWMSSALRALSSLCFGEMDTLVNKGHDPVEDLLVRPVVLELDALSQTDKTFITAGLILWIHHFRMAEPSREVLKGVVVIEEAHNILSDQRSSLVGGQGVMELAFREAREYGLSLVCLDQMPSTIAPSALANTYAVICFNLKHRSDMTAMSSAMMLDEDDKAVLGNLQVGEAIVRLQGRGTRPFMIHVPEFYIQKGAFTDTHVIHHMTRLGLLSARNHEQQRPPRLESADQNKEKVRIGDFAVAEPIQMFIRDIAAFPEGGVAERYKRLGLSVRQGQKTKELSAASGLIQEQVLTTSRGKIRVIRLTEKGRMTLGTPERTPTEAG